METVVLIVLAVVVALVAIDAIAKLDERAARKREAAGKGRRRDDGLVTTQKIVIDLTRRG
jgi:hypothetical protein